MAHPFIDEINNIVDLGTASVKIHKKQQEQLINLINNLRSAEKSFYSKINFKGQKVHSTAELNALIKTIDNDMKIGTLLPKGEVEARLSKIYILSDSSKEDWSSHQREIMARVLNVLLKEGLDEIDKKVTNSRAQATLLSDVRNRIIAAIQAGLTKHVTLSDKKTIVDPATISSYMLNKTEVLGVESLNIAFGTIRGSQAARDFEWPAGTTRDQIMNTVTIRTKSDGKFIPLKNISDELATYLLNIAEEVLTTPEDAPNCNWPCSSKYSWFFR